MQLKKTFRVMPRSSLRVALYDVIWQSYWNEFMNDLNIEVNGYDGGMLVNELISLWIQSKTLGAIVRIEKS